VGIGQEIGVEDHGKLLIIAKLAEWLKPPTASERGKKGGRGNKASIPPIPAFSKNTLSLYRKIGDHAKR
jgi:hypothetical protein